MDVLRQIKYNRGLLKLNDFLKSLEYFDGGDPNSDYYGYYEYGGDYEYIFVTITKRYMDISNKLKETCLSDEDIISVIEKFTRRFNYKISWVD